MSRVPGGVTAELLGPPGAGKSTLADALRGVGGVAVVKDHTVGDLCALAGGVAGSLPWALHPPPGIPPARWLAWSGRLKAARAVARRRHRRGRATVVFDQGPAYTLLRIRQARGCTEEARPTVSTVTEALDLLVWVDADPLTLSTRLRGRAKEHAALALPESRLAAYVEQERAACRSLSDEVARHGTRVLRLDTAVVPVEEQADLVLGCLATVPARR